MESGGSGYIGSNFINDNTKNVRSLMGSLGLAAPRDEQGDEQCLEKRVYYRLISGMLAILSKTSSMPLTQEGSRFTCVHIYSHMFGIP